MSFATHHLVFILSCGLALLIAWWLGRKQKMSAVDAVFRIIAVGLITARLVFILIYHEAYLNSPVQILNVRDGGFNLWAGLLAGAGWMLFELRLHPTARKAIGVATVSGFLIGIVLNWILLDPIHKTEFPRAALYDLNDQPVNLARTFKDQPVVINLWASWCPPCVREMPVLQDAVDKWPNIAFVAINQGEDLATVQSFLDKQNLELPHVLLDPQTQIGDELEAYVLPTTLFFNADGSLSYAHVGEFSPATLEQAVNRLR